MTPSRSPIDLLCSLPAGTRVTVRWTLPGDDASGKRFTDSIGTILGSSFAPAVNSDDDAGTTAAQVPSDRLRLETRNGEVSIAWDAIHLAKPVPPPPPRRAPRAR